MRRIALLIIALALQCLSGCSYDSLPADWAAVPLADCRWIDGQYQARGRAVDDDGKPAEAVTVGLYGALLPHLIGREPMDGGKVSAIERVDLRFDEAAGKLSVTPLGADLPPNDLDFTCHDGRLSTSYSGPTFEKDWVGVGTETREAWQDSKGGLIVRASDSAVIAAYLFFPMAGASSKIYRFERYTPGN